MSEPRRRLLPTFAAFACVAIAVNAQSAVPPRDRHEFADAIGKVEEGMSRDDVLSLLGRPDDVRTKHDPGGISTVGTKEIWRYGTSEHLTTATLGQIYLDEKDCVQYVFGKGGPPRDGMFKERDLRILLDALGDVPSYNLGWQYNPRKVIRAVNLLQPLGKEKALAVIEEFLRVASDWHDGGREGVFLVLRTLSDVPDDPGYMPPMFVGSPTPFEPKDKKLIPRFPIAIEGDIPFLLVEGYRLFGQAQRPESHVDYFRKHGRVRGRPLVPSAQPFNELTNFEKSPRWIYSGAGLLHMDERGRQFLEEQLLRLIDNVYRVEPGPTGNLLPFGDHGADRRNRIIEEAGSLKIHWDAGTETYSLGERPAD